MPDLISSLSLAFALIASSYVAVYHSLNFIMVFLAWFEATRKRGVNRQLTRRIAEESGELPGVSVVIPAYNEEVPIVQTVKSVLNTRYPDLEVIVVNDGSTDRTLKRLWQAFKLSPCNEAPEAALTTQSVRAVFKSAIDSRLKIIDKRNGGKADALNAAINYGCKELICTIDADVLLQPESILELALPFAEDPTTVASGGLLRPRNGCKLSDNKLIQADLPGTWLERFQVLEYIRSFGVGRLFFNRINAHLIISGAFGLFRRQIVIDAGGYQAYAIGEDMELVVRLHRYLKERGDAYRIVFVPNALCLTEAPYSVRDLGKQRTRWHQGLLTSLRLHKVMLWNPKYGTVGMVAFPYFRYFELLSPFVEAAGWIMIPLLWGLGWLAPGGFAFFAAVTLVFSSLVSLEAVLLDTALFAFFPKWSQGIQLLALALLEPFGYHQLNLYFRLRAFPRYYRSIHLKGGWRSPARIGRESSSSTAINPE